MPLFQIFGSWSTIILSSSWPSFFGILNRRPLLIFLGLAFLSPYVHDLLDLDFAQRNLFSGIFLIGLALEFLYGNRQKKGLTKDYKVNKNDQEGPHISVKTYMAEDRYRIYSQEVETVDMNMAFGELWLDLSQASFASSQVAVHLDAKFGEVHIRLPHGCVIGYHWNLTSPIICKGGSF